MADRKNWYFKQVVTEAEMDSSDSALEAADRNLAIDWGLAKGSTTYGGGVCYGLDGWMTGPTQPASAGMRVLSGTAYDNLGRRMRHAASPWTSIDVRRNGYTGIGVTGTMLVPDGAEITPSVGQERWVSIFILSARLLSDPRTDGSGAPVYFSEAESFQFYVKCGPLHAYGTSPETPDVTLEADKVLLFETVLSNHAVYGIEVSYPNDTRRQAWINYAGAPYSLEAYTPRDAIVRVLMDLNDHINGVSGGQAASSVTYAGGPTWRDGTTNPSTNVEAQLDKIVTDLIARDVASHSGAHKIGAAAIAGAPLFSGVSTVGAQLQYLYDHLNGHVTGSELDHYAGQINYQGSSGHWADSTVLPASSVETALDSIVALLGASTTVGGTEKVGSKANGAPGSPGVTGLIALPAGGTFGQLTTLQDGVNSRIQRTGDAGLTGTYRPASLGGASLGTSSYKYANVYGQSIYGDYVYARSLLEGNTALDVRGTARPLAPIARFFGRGPDQDDTYPASVLDVTGHVVPRSHQFRDHFYYKANAGLDTFYTRTVAGGGGAAEHLMLAGNIYGIGGVVRSAMYSNAGNPTTIDLKSASIFAPWGTQTQPLYPRMHLTMRARRTLGVTGNAVSTFGFRRTSAPTTFIQFMCGATIWMGSVGSPSGTNLVNLPTNDGLFHIFEIITQFISQDAPIVGRQVIFGIDEVYSAPIRIIDSYPGNGYARESDYEFYINGTGIGAFSTEVDLDVDFVEITSDSYRGAMATG